MYRPRGNAGSGRVSRRRLPGRTGNSSIGTVSATDASNRRNSTLPCGQSGTSPVLRKLKMSRRPLESPIATLSDLQKILVADRIGRPVELGYVRFGELRRTTVTPAEAR